MQFDLEWLLQNISQVKLRGGVVGKVSLTVIVVSVSIAAIAWSVQNLWISLLALLAVFGLAFVMLWRLISFADKNPQAALLEGAEFLAHEQLKLGSKNQPEIIVEPSDREQPQPVEGEAANPDRALEPDDSNKQEKLEGGKS